MSTALYVPIASADEDQNGRSFRWDLLNRRSELKKIFLALTMLLLGFIAGIALAQGVSWFKCTIPPSGQILSQGLYSPVQSAIRYVPTVFEGGFGLDSTPYSGPPSMANNAAWSDLYNFGISRISAEEARPMLNKTLPIPHDKDHYIISLSVFHQIHCLNKIRVAVYEGVDWTDVDDGKGVTHIDHCINSVRQSLMCSADITPLTWRRDSRDGYAKEMMEVAHSCRDFESIKQWGLDRKLLFPFNHTQKVTDDALGWGVYEE